jgi:hypothetical protein
VKEENVKGKICRVQKRRKNRAEGGRKKERGGERERQLHRIFFSWQKRSFSSSSSSPPNAYASFSLPSLLVSATSRLAEEDKKGVRRKKGRDFEGCGSRFYLLEGIEKPSCCCRRDGKSLRQMQELFGGRRSETI